MKKSILFCLLFFAIILNAAKAQNYTEYTDGWGYGWSRPTICVYDIDGDGLYDILVGQENSPMKHYEQKEIGAFEFELINSNFNNINISYAVPTIGDIDGDGLLDLIIGNDNGELYRYEQISPNSYEFELITAKFSDINVIMYSAPQFVDLNGDTLLDLTIMNLYCDLYIYEQNPIDKDQFTLVKVIDMSNKSYGVHSIADIDGDGTLDLILGSWSKYLQHYKQDSIVLDSFYLHKNNFYSIGDYNNWGLSPCLFDLNNDGKLELITCCSEGKVYISTQLSNDTTVFGEIIDSNLFKIMDYGGHGDFVIYDIDGNGKLDILFCAYSSANEYVKRFEQAKKGELDFILIDHAFSDIKINGSFNSPTLTDFDGNGFLDLLIGDASRIKHYKQDTINRNLFNLESELFNDINITLEKHPEFYDINGDGRLDLLIGKRDGQLAHYIQDSIDSDKFHFSSDAFDGIDFGLVASPVFTDIDGDFSLDLIIGGYGASLKRWKQDSLNSYSFNFISGNFADVKASDYCFPQFADINDDGAIDLLVQSHGGIALFLREDLFAPEVPKDLTAISLVSGAIKLQWTNPEISDYHSCAIYRSSYNLADSSVLIANIGKELNSFIDDYELSNMARYYYWIKVRDNVGNISDFSAVDSAVSEDKLAPAVPENLNAYAFENSIILSWDKNLESDLSGYIIYRSLIDNFIPSHTDSISIILAPDTSFTDNAVNLDTVYYYKITAYDVNGNISESSGQASAIIVDVDQIRNVIPEKYSLSQNYPNPFNPKTIIVYALPKKSAAIITVYNILGERISELINREVSAGEHSIEFDGSNLASGIYLIELKTESLIDGEKFRDVKKAALLK